MVSAACSGLFFEVSSQYIWPSKGVYDSAQIDHRNATVPTRLTHRLARRKRCFTLEPLPPAIAREATVIVAIIAVVLA